LAAGFDGDEDDPFELRGVPASDFPEPDFSDPDRPESDFPVSDFPESELFESELFESLLASEVPELEPLSLDFELPFSDSEPDRLDELRLSVL